LNEGLYAPIFNNKNGLSAAIQNNQLFCGMFRCLFVFIILSSSRVAAQIPIIDLENTSDNTIVSSEYYRVLEDTSRKFSSVEAYRKFLQAGSSLGLKNVEKTTSDYWVAFGAHLPANDESRWLLEFIDPHISTLQVFFTPADTILFRQYLPEGMAIPFAQKQYGFKNYLFPIAINRGSTAFFLVKINSESRTSFFFKFHKEPVFIAAATNEYYQLGFFYGIIAIAMITNLLIFLFIRERTYLYYTIYLIGCSLLFLSEDGLGFQYWWPNNPAMNHYVELFSPTILLLSFYFYSRRFFRFNAHLPRGSKLINWIMILSTGYFMISPIVSNYPIDFRFYFLPFASIYGAALILSKRGLRSARHFVFAHSFIIVGILFMVFRKAGINILNTPLTYYSLHIGFVIEIAVLTYVLGQRMEEFKTLRIKAQEKLVQQLKAKQEAQNKLLEQMKENQLLKDKHNEELEAEVQVRTKEVFNQNILIATQNNQLQEANDKLIEQADKINRLNQHLDLDNWALKSNIKKIEEARVLSKAVDLPEFSKIYPDDNACLRFLAEKKWGINFNCRKCGHDNYCAGKTEYSRRCTKCRYEESATAFTLLHKCKIPLTKAFYSIFLIYRSKGQVSSVHLSEVLKIRQSTCWSFSQKITTAMKKHKSSDLRGWDSILVEEVTEKVSSF